ncbi:ATP-binding cassette domain-containing protein [Tropicibacter sp. R16_0]|uniref:ABC transporter ATP-binding protein n=1 Tax=Tropicibacter sp. R16_0 TaxID=2821102 RepID=UPI001ADB478C|nr:ATP-binding cassette domain-containing protein [Tropicibacter sp. R16_0]MBO9449834.1 ATP-binding cassette domain-containing protein [Tropicibacter sp. R16_0]
MPELLEVQQLSAGYGPLRVLHEVDLTVRAGERLGLVGLNGHGKTTLMRALTHMTSWQQGSIKLDGAEIGGTRSLGAGRRTSGLVRRGIGVAPQGDAIFPGLSVRKHLECGAHTKTAWRARQQRIEQIFDIFPPLRPLEHALVGKLSGGERRMVSIGRMLMVEARLYLVDEPSLGLAPKISERVMTALWDLPVEGAMIIAEQNVALLTGRCDRVIGMHAGRMRGDVGHVGLG